MEKLQFCNLISELSELLSVYHKLFEERSVTNL